MSPQFDWHIMELGRKNILWICFDRINSFMPWGENRVDELMELEWFFARGSGVLQGQNWSTVRIRLAQDRSPRDPLTSAKCFGFSTAGCMRRCWDDRANPAWQFRTTKSIFVSPKLRILKATGCPRLALWSRQGRSVFTSLPNQTAGPSLSPWNHSGRQTTDCCYWRLNIWWSSASLWKVWLLSYLYCWKS